MNILIFEDEEYNYALLRDLLLEQMPGCRLIGPLASIAEGHDFFAGSHGDIDLIIADIQLSDGLSFQALAEAPDDIPIIFTTAYDEYALQAFGYNSLSFLLKPVDGTELRLAIRKSLKHLVTDKHREELFLDMNMNMRYRKRFVVHTYKGDLVIPVSHVRYIVSEQKYTFLVLTDGSSHVVNQPLKTLSEELDPDEFMLINRKYIVPFREIKSFEKGINGNEWITIRGDDDVQIAVSRNRKKEIHARIKGNKH